MLGFSSISETPISALSGQTHDADISIDCISDIRNFRLDLSDNIRALTNIKLLGLCFTPVYSGATSSGFTTSTLNASGIKIAMIWQNPYTSIPYSTVGYYYNSRTGTPPTYKIGLQGVDSSGNPDGIYKTNGSECSATFTPPADTTWNNTWRTAVLNASYTPSCGEFVALVIEYSSGTIDGTNNSSFGTGWTGMGARYMGFPNLRTNNGISWAKSSNRPILMVQSTNYKIGYPFFDNFNTNITTSGDIQVATFNFGSPGFPYFNYFQILGVRMIAKFTAGGTFKWYRDTGEGTTSVTSAAVDTDMFASPNSESFYEYYFTELGFTMQPIRAGGYTFRIGLMAQGSALGIRGIQYNSVGDELAYPGGTCYLASYNSTTKTWTNLNVRPWFELILGGAA